MSVEQDPGDGVVGEAASLWEKLNHRGNTTSSVSITHHRYKQYPPTPHTFFYARPLSGMGPCLAALSPLF